MDNVAGRYQLVDTLVRAPGNCWISKTSDGLFIDTGTSIKFNETGQLYISVTELREMAEVAGLFEGLVKEDPNRDTVQREIGYAEGINENGNLNSAIARVLDSADRIGSILDRVDVSSSAKQPADNDPGHGEQPEDSGVFVTAGNVERVGADGATGAVDEAPRQVTRPRRNSRPARISASAGNDNPFRI